MSVETLESGVLGSTAVMDKPTFLPPSESISPKRGRPPGKKDEPVAEPSKRTQDLEAKRRHIVELAITEIERRCDRLHNEKTNLSALNYGQEADALAKVVELLERLNALDLD